MRLFTYGWIPVARIRVLYLCTPAKIGVYVFTQPFYNKQDVTQGQFSKWSKAGLNSEFSIC